MYEKTTNFTGELLQESIDSRTDRESSEIADKIIGKFNSFERHEILNKLCQKLFDRNREEMEGIASSIKDSSELLNNLKALNFSLQ